MLQEVAEIVGLQQKVATMVEEGQVSLPDRQYYFVASLGLQPLEYIPVEPGH